MMPIELDLKKLAPEMRRKEYYMEPDIRHIKASGFFLGIMWYEVWTNNMSAQLFGEFDDLIKI